MKLNKFLREFERRFWSKEIAPFYYFWKTVDKDRFCLAFDGFALFASRLCFPANLVSALPFSSQCVPSSLTDRRVLRLISRLAYGP